MKQLIRIVCCVASVAFFLCRVLDAQTQAEQIGVEKAITAVYPALVRIHVVIATYSEGRAQKLQAAGSGVIISADGYVLTNHHVAGKATSIKCVLTTKQELDAKLVGTDALTDLAVLKLDLSALPENNRTLPYARFGSSDSLKIGDRVLAMGCPLALSQSVTQGSVANKEMIFSQRFMGPMLLDGENVGLLVRWIAHDAQILPGNSGGPLVNLQGEIVGINEINIGGGGGLGGAIPSELAQSVAQQIIEKGTVPRSWIGVDFQPLLKGSSNRSGVLVSGVIPDSPAASAGLRAGDVILAIDDKPVKVEFPEQLPPLNRIILSSPIGSKLQLKVLRNEKQDSLSIQTIAREDALGKRQESKEWGIVVQELTSLAAQENHLVGHKGILVGSVRSGGPADQANPPLQAGDLLEQISGNPVLNSDSFFDITSRITKGQANPVTTTAEFRRNAEELVTVVEVGIRPPQSPTPEARKAWLPVKTQVLTRKLATALGVSGKKGVRITNVIPDSSAEKAGLMVGDILTNIDGQQIEASELQDTKVFEDMVHAYRIGSKPEFTVIRDGKTMQLAADLVEQPKPERQLPVYENVELEFKARDISEMDRINMSLEGQSGALVTEVVSGGWAGIGGLNVGDLIQAVNNSPVTSIADLKPLMDAGNLKHEKYVALLVRRGIRNFFLELQPVWPEHH